MQVMCGNCNKIIDIDNNCQYICPLCNAKITITKRDKDNYKEFCAWWSNEKHKIKYKARKRELIMAYIFLVYMCLLSIWTIVFIIMHIFNV